ncbi:MAG: nickel pincer cofactor biosynthesis protein LarC [Holophagaceae bacterium]|nr:nickel pincer cofactor biosynthesis protein LarC [Holophagaceae bacterium]
MKTLYFECNMGASGDMLMGALLELCDDQESFLKRLNDLGIPGVSIKAGQSIKCGITGTGVKVEIDGREEGPDMHKHGHSREHQGHRSHSHDHGHRHGPDQGHSHDGHSHSHSHGHAHSNHFHSHDDNHSHKSHKHDHGSFSNIEHLLGHLKISDRAKLNALGVYKLIAEAESHAHGVPVSQVHFHEVGEMDAVADIVGVCMLMEELAPDLVLASPINVGSGHVHCAHGTLPVPAPATVHILRDVPIYADHTEGELCTPTGAAILKFFVTKFCKMPKLTISRIGYGMGKKNFGAANCVRTFIGESTEEKISQEQVIELVCNLDDMTPEALAFAQQLLLDEGALDAYTTHIGMKKGRAGLSLTCMCRAAEREKMLLLIFKHTSTLGIREYTSRRYFLNNEQSEIDTEYGTVRIKTSQGFDIKKSKPEYEDIAEIALKNGISIQEVLKSVKLSTTT